MTGSAEYSKGQARLDPVKREAPLAEQTHRAPITPSGSPPDREYECRAADLIG